MSVPQIAIDAALYYASLGQPPLPLTGAVALAAVQYAGESKLNPGPQPSTASTDHGGVLYPQGAYGISSWNGDRQKSLRDFATMRGLPVENVQTQQRFTLAEIANSYPATWAAIRSPSATLGAIVQVIVEEYEGPANPTAEITRSTAFANDLMAALLALPTDTTPVVPPVAVVPPPAASPTLDALRADAEAKRKAAHDALKAAGDAMAAYHKADQALQAAKDAQLASETTELE